MTDKSYQPPCRNYLQPLYLSVTLYACAQREVVEIQKETSVKMYAPFKSDLNNDMDHMRISGTQP